MFIIILFGIKQLNKLWKKTFQIFTICQVSWDTLYIYERWKLLIYKVTLYLINNVEDIIVFLGLKVLNSDISYDSLYQKCKTHFAEKPQSKIIRFKKYSKAFQGTIVYRALPSLHEGSFEIKLTVPLKSTLLKQMHPFQFQKLSKE